jgi:hypothetical protein
MKIRSIMAGAAMLACAGLVLAAEIKSGPQVGQGVAAFHPYNVFNAESKDLCGKENCIVCQYGTKPVALVFARSTGEPVAALIKKLDAEVAKLSQEKMGAAVIFLSEDDNIKEKVSQLAEKNDVKNVSLAVDGSSGPAAYKLAKEADVTVILYNKKKVVVNHAFEKFTGECVERVIADLPKVATN